MERDKVGYFGVANDEFSGVGYKNLKCALQCASIQEGFQIFCDGGGDKRYEKKYRLFFCSKGVKSRAKINFRLSQKYRKYTASNDRKNSRDILPFPE